MNKLAERAVLMRFSAGFPGKHRGDKKTTAEVKAEKNLLHRGGVKADVVWA